MIINLLSSKYMLFVSLAFVLITSLIFLAPCRIKKIVPFLICIYIASVSQIIIVFEIASIFQKVNNVLFVLIGNFGFFLIGLIFWLSRKRPPVFGFLNLENIKDSLSKSNLKEAISHSKTIVFFSFFVFLTYIYTAYLIVFYPQNIDDLLTTYLARIGFWLQYGSFNIWATPQYYLPQTISPANGQILQLWMMLFYRTDQYTAFVPWISSLFSIFAIYGLCRILNQPKNISIFVSLLYISIPSVILQLSSSQVDLIAANFFICSIYLLCLGWIGENWIYLLFSALSFSLGLGTKQTLFFAVPSLIVLLIILSIKYPVNWKKNFLVFTIWGILSFFLVGSYIYIQNFVIFGSMLGPGEVVSDYSRMDSFSILNQIYIGLSNLSSYLLNCFFSSIFTNEVQMIVDYIPVRLIPFFNFRPNGLRVSVGTMGPTISLLIFLTLFSLIRKHNNLLHLGFALGGTLYLFILLSTKAFSFAFFRYSLISITILIPLIGEADFWHEGNNPAVFKPDIIKIVSIVSILTIIWVNLANGSKSVFQMIDQPYRNRTTKQIEFMALTEKDPTFLSTFKNIDEFIPLNAHIGIIGSGKYPISPLFGKLYSRTVDIFIPENGNLFGTKDFSGIDYLVIDTQYLMYDTKTLQQFVPLTNDGTLRIFKRQ